MTSPPSNSGSVSRLITLPERMAAMRCNACKRGWSSMDDATNQYPVSCPHCGSGFTEPAFDLDGTEMPEGWTW